MISLKSKKKNCVGDARNRKPMEFSKNRGYVRGTRNTGNKTSGCILDTLKF